MLLLQYHGCAETLKEAALLPEEMLSVGALLQGMLVFWEGAHLHSWLFHVECSVEIVVSTEILQSRCGGQ